MDQTGAKPKSVPGETQEHQPGLEADMDPPPQYLAPNYRGTGKLKDKVAIITGGDSGIGRSVGILYAREGCKGVTIMYLDEDEDAKVTQKQIEKEGAQCLLVRGDISDSKLCDSAVEQTVKKFGRLDILVNNAAKQFYKTKLEEITDEQLEKTFKINIFAYFYMARAALPHLKKGSSIINTGSVTSYKGKEVLLDYSATKGAIKSFTYSLSAQLADRGIRVNGVAPGPIWTPLIPATFPAEDVAEFGKKTPLGRPGQPEEVSPCYVFLASEADSSYITGQILHPNGGYIIHG